MLKKFLKKILKYKKTKSTVYTGRGYIQGMGVDIQTDSFEILGQKFITNIRLKVDEQWLRTLKKRIKKDDDQQSLEKNGN